MKTLVYRGPRQLALEEADIPSPGPGEILVKVEAVGICGSELEGYLGHSAVRRAPLVMGHEFAGTVAAAGDPGSGGIGAETGSGGVEDTTESEADAALGQSGAAGIPVGSRVIVNPLIACGQCVRCREGRPNVCRDRRIVGIHRPGAFADYVAVPAHRAIVVPPGMDAGLASLAEPLAVCVHALRLGLGLGAEARAAASGEPTAAAQANAGPAAEAGSGGAAGVGAAPADLLVLGAGPIGLLALQAARAMGVRRVLIVDRQPARLAFAERLGGIPATPEALGERLAETFGAAGVDAAIDCVGVRQTREAAIRAVNAGGRVALVGLGQDDSELPMNHVVRQELTLYGSYTYGEDDFAQAVRLLASGAIVREGWTGAATLAEAPEAFAELAEGRSRYGKIIVCPGV